MYTRFHALTMTHPLTLSWWPSWHQTRSIHTLLTNHHPHFSGYSFLIPHSSSVTSLSLSMYRPVQLTNRCPTQIINCVHPHVALGRLICTLQEPCLIAFSAGWLKPSHKSLVLLTLNWAIRLGMVSTTAIHTCPHTTCLYFSRVAAS